jgi:hypothetical protein
MKIQVTFEVDAEMAPHFLETLSQLVEEEAGWDGVQILNEDVPMGASIQSDIERIDKAIDELLDYIPQHDKDAALDALNDARSGLIYQAEKLNRQPSKSDIEYVLGWFWAQEERDFNEATEAMNDPDRAAYFFNPEDHPFFYMKRIKEALDSA